MQPNVPFPSLKNMGRNAMHTLTADGIKNVLLLRRNSGCAGKSAKSREAKGIAALPESRNPNLLSAFAGEGNSRMQVTTK